MIIVDFFTMSENDTMTQARPLTTHDYHIAELVRRATGLQPKWGSPEHTWQVVEALIVNTPRHLRDKQYTLPKLRLLREGLDSLERSGVMEDLRGSKEAEALIASMIETLEGYRRDIAKGAATPDAIKD